MYQTKCKSIPQDIEVQSQADYVSLCYTYNFLLQMDGIFAYCADNSLTASKTQEFLRQIERSFSKLTVYLYQVIWRGQQYEGMTLPELDKWPSMDLCGLHRNLLHEEDIFEEELEPNLPSKPIRKSRKPKP